MAILEAVHYFTTISSYIISDLISMTYNS